MSEEVRLTPRWPRYAAIAGAVILGLGMVVAVAAILVETGPGAPSAAERRALADEVCPAITATHFYKVSKDGKTSYLLATRHAGVDLAKFPPAVEQAFRASKVAVFESALGHDPEPAAPATGPSVEEQLGPDLWGKYRELVGGDAAERVSHRSPIVASATLLMLYEDTSRTLDRELYRLAEAAHKRIVVLEDRVESDHLGEVYLGIDSLRSFVKALRDRDALKASVRVTLRQYCNGGDDSGTLGPQLAATTDKRTAAWVPKLEALFAEGDVFVAVGMMHVEDGAGLIHVLRERGYKVER